MICIILAISITFAVYECSPREVEETDLVCDPEKVYTEQDYCINRNENDEQI